jgi:hypothetical protein
MIAIRLREAPRRGSLEHGAVLRHRGCLLHTGEGGAAALPPLAPAAWPKQGPSPNLPAPPTRLASLSSSRCCRAAISESWFVSERASTSCRSGRGSAPGSKGRQLERRPRESRPFAAAQGRRAAGPQIPNSAPTAQPTTMDGPSPPAPPPAPRSAASHPPAAGPRAPRR